MPAHSYTSILMLSSSFACTLWLLVGVALIAPVRSNNMTRVSIHIPFPMHHKQGEDHTAAQFGFSTTVQGSISAYVYYVDAGHHLCNAIDWNSNGTEGFPKHDGGLKSPYILMTNTTGPCSSVTKVRHAQLDGAAAVILAHDTCRCDDVACTKLYGDHCVEPKEVQEYMVSDGSASDVSIPSFLLYRVVAEQVAAELKKDQPVLMELTWGLPGDTTVATPTVDFSLWTTAHDPLLNLDTYSHIATIAKAMAPQAMFKPRYSLIDGSRFKCNEEVDSNGPCDHLCTNHGRYCAIHAWDLSGHAIVTETLRRLCIFKHFGTDLYWDYVLYHREHCGTYELYANEDCLKKTLKETKIDDQIIQQCFTDTGGLEDDHINAMLQEQMDFQAESSVLALPALTVGHRVLDTASSWNLFEGLCHHFFARNLTTTPDVCFTCASCPNVIGCVEHGKCVDFEKPKAKKEKHHDDDGNKKHRHHGWTVFWMFVLMGSIGGGYYYYKQQQDNEGFLRRGGTLNSYFQLTGEES